MYTLTIELQISRLFWRCNRIRAKSCKLTSKSVFSRQIIVLGGCAGVEQAAKNAGQDVRVPFTPGRADTSPEKTDVESFAVLEPTADGFRNYTSGKHSESLEELLVDRAHLLTLSAPEMTALVGGLRVLGTNFNASPYGVFTDRSRRRKSVEIPNASGSQRQK
jgi:catalase-peroxidase